MDLPQEILCHILAFLDSKKVIKQMRLVNRLFAVASTSYLFDSVQLSATTEDLRHAKLIRDRFKQLIKTIIVIPVAYEYVPPHLDYDYPVTAARGRLWSKKSHLVHRFDTCRRLYIESQEILKAKSLQRSFLDLLGAQNIKSIVFKDAYSPRRDINTLRQECCPQPNNCTESRRFHKFFAVFPNLLPQEVIAKLLSSLLLVALSASKNTKAFAVESSNDSFSLVETTFQMPIDKGHKKSLALSSLTHLRLIFGYSSINGAMPRKYNRRLVKCPSLFPNLEHLSIDVGAASRELFKYQGITSFQAVFRRCRFKKLRVLELIHTNSKANELGTLLFSMPTLQTLTIVKHTLESGLWYDIIEQLAERSYFVEVHIDEIREGFDKRWINDKWSDWFGEIDAFLLGNGPNPFSLEQLSLWDDKKAARQSQRRGYVWA